MSGLLSFRKCHHSIARCEPKIGPAVKASLSVSPPSKRRGIRGIAAIAELGALCLASSDGRSCALGNETALFLGKGSIEVQHEGIGIRAELRHDERHTLGP